MNIRKHILVWSAAIAGFFVLSTTVPAAPPRPSTPHTPRGTVSMAYPVFEWNAVAASSWYQLWFNRNGSFFWSEWVQSANTWTSWWDFTEYPGEYQWWVQTWNAEGSGRWSSSAAFIVVPGAVTNIGGVSGNQGQIQLAAGSNIQISPDEASKRITISAESAPSGAFIMTQSSNPPSGYTWSGTSIESRSRSWRTMAPMPTARYGLAVAEVDGKIYAIGGYNGGRLNTVEMYDPATDTWTSRADMPTPRYRLTAAAVNGRIYAIGGDNGTPCNVVEEYDPSTDSWDVKNVMPTGRYEPASAVVGDNIYVMGGKSLGALPVVEVYNVTSNSWSSASNMGTAREALAATVVDGNIYAIGGYNGGYLTTVEMYEPAVGAWRSLAGISQGRESLAAAALNGRIYAFGGDDTKAVATVEKYNPSSDTWVTEGELNTEHASFGGLAVGDDIYAIGGYQNLQISNVVERFTAKLLYTHQKN